MQKRLQLAFFVLTALLLSPSLGAAGDRFQVIDYKERGPVLLLETSTQRSLECTFRSADKTPTQGGWSFLSVDSDPGGADVFVDSEYQGKTPLQNLKVPSGNIPVALVKDGFGRQTTRISLRPGERRSLGIMRLASMYGEISINSYPPRASIFLDGDKIKVRTPVTIRRVPRDKQHTLRIELDGYHVWERDVNLDEKDNKRYEVDLEKN